MVYGIEKEQDRLSAFRCQVNVDTISECTSSVASPALSRLESMSANTLEVESESPEKRMSSRITLSKFNPQAEEIKKESLFKVKRFSNEGLFDL